MIFNSITPMNVYPEKIIKYLAFIIVLLSLFWFLDSSSLAGRYKDTAAGSGLGQLEVKENKITVNIKDVPLHTLLNAIREKRGVWFEGDKDLLARKVSVKFEDLPLIEGIKRILYPLSYAMIFDSKGSLRGLYIVESDESVIKTDIANKPVTKQVLSIADEPDFREERKGSHVDYKVPAIPKKLPPFTPHSNDTGPPVDPDKTCAELPEFIPFENDTGPPIDPKKVYKGLPEFTPFTTDVGPSPEGKVSVP